MRKGLLVLGLLIAGIWLLWGSPLRVPAPATPAVPSPANPTPSSDRTHSSAADPTPAPTTPAPSARSSQAAPAADEEGTMEGGFDPAQPPAGAPDAASLQLAFAQASKYVESINSYGYGDPNINDFILRSKPYMTPDFYEEWNDIGAIASEQGTDSGAWATYQKTKTRHAARVGAPIVTKWTGTTLELAVPYRTADVVPGSPVPDAATERFARVRLIRAGDTWLVQQSVTDF